MQIAQASPVRIANIPSARFYLSWPVSGLASQTASPSHAVAQWF
jgi:hypothetical protein